MNAITPMLVSSKSTRLQLGLLVATVLLGGALRLTGLGGRPYGLFRDEAEKGYNAWALATSGGAVDFSGGVGEGPPIRWRRLPWMIDVMGGKTSAIYQYASVPAIWIGGLNVTTTRLTAGLIGALTVALAGWLAWGAWGGWAGVAAALALALSPWHVNFSRWAAEGIFVPFFIFLTLGGLLGIERGRRWGAPLAGAALGWLFYAYSGAQPFVAAWGLALLILYWNKLFHLPPAAVPARSCSSVSLGKMGPLSARVAYAWPLGLGVVLFLIPVVPTLLVRLAPGGSSRLAAVAIWSDPAATPLGVAAAFINNYFAHFSPRFLFLIGDLQPRHNVAGGGELLWPDLIFIPLGFFFLRRRGLPLRGALAGALLCGPLPAAIARDGAPHALRALPLVVPLMLWAGAGLAGGLSALGQVLGKRKNVKSQYKILLIFIIITGYVAAGGVNSFARRYWVSSAHDPAVLVAFEAGERQAWETLIARRRPDQRVFVNGNIPYVPYYQAFYFRPDPRRLGAPGGLEAAGFLYFSPERTSPETLERMMAPGDWLVNGAPAATVTLPGGEPLLPREDVHRVSEAWVWTRQKDK